VLVLEDVDELVGDGGPHRRGHLLAPDVHDLLDRVVEGQAALAGHVGAGGGEVDVAGDQAEGPQHRRLVLDLLLLAVVVGRGLLGGHVPVLVLGEEADLDRVLELQLPLLRHPLGDGGDALVPLVDLLVPVPVGGLLPSPAVVPVVAQHHRGDDGHHADDQHGGHGEQRGPLRPASRPSARSLLGSRHPSALIRTGDGQTDRLRRSRASPR
jgi:hypothetical protein